MRGCALFGNGGTSSGIEVAGPNGGIGVQALIENNFIQGFGTGIDGNAPGHSGFLITIRGNTIQGNATGIDFSPAAGDGLENARVENNNISNNNTGIITTGPSVEVSILGNSFDANSVNAINATNSIIYADNNHFENPDLTSPTEYVLFNGGSMVIHGGWMMERRTSGTYPWMISASGFGTLVVDSPYLSSGGGTVSNFVTVSGTTISPVLNVMLPSGFANLFSVPNGVTPGLYGLSGLQSGNGKVATAIANSQAASMNVDGASNVTFKLGSSPFLTRTASNYVLSGNNIPILTSFTTSSAEGDNVTVTGMTAKGHCSSPTATNSIATTITGIYISGKTTNRITVNHSVKAGGTFDISCTPN
jgi:Periplasmic copper-binding protein (NosD)